MSGPERDNSMVLKDETQAKDFAVFTKVYHLYLKIYYKCKEGQSIAVSGSLPSLGNWKEFSELVWTAGDIWVSKEPIVSTIHFF